MNAQKYNQTRLQQAKLYKGKKAKRDWSFNRRNARGSEVRTLTQQEIKALYS